MERLRKFFSDNPRVAIAFSGGVDSAFLLYAAKHFGAEATAYYMKTPFQPQFETDDAVRLASELDMPMVVLKGNPLEDEDVVKNPSNRCYYCKRIIFSSILKKASEDGFGVILDGTNASDDISDRPGYKALQEMKVLSPLKSCGLTKDEIRRLSKEAGLFTWNKPSYACLATRIPTGTSLTEELLERTEKAEDYLFSLGFSDFRVRYRDGNALLEMKEEQLPLLLEMRENIARELKRYYKGVALSLECR